MDPIPERALAINPEKAALIIGDFAEHHGLPRKDVYTVAEAAELARRLGYACTPGTVLEFQRKRYLSDPGETWEAAHVFCLISALESRRRWLPTPCPQHDAKKSAARLEVERLVAEGVEMPVADLDSHTIEDLLLQLCQNDHRQIREALYEALRLKLAGFEE